MDLKTKTMTAKSAVEELQKPNPDFPLWKSIIAQLEFILSDFEEDGTFRNAADEERVGDLKLGLQAVREIESTDPELADLLCQIDYEYKNLYLVDR